MFVSIPGSIEKSEEIDAKGVGVKGVDVSIRRFSRGSRARGLLFLVLFFGCFCFIVLVNFLCI